MHRYSSIPAILQVVFLIWASQEAKSANILMSGIVGKGSHFLSLVPIGKSLVRQGHNVTCLIFEEYKERADDPNLNKYFNFEIYKSTDPEYTTKEYFQFISELGFNENEGVLDFFKMLPLLKVLFEKTCLFVLEDKAMMKRFQKLDAIVSDFSWPCSTLMKMYLKKHTNNTNIRLIMNVPNTPNAIGLDWVGSPVNTAYQPGFTSGYTSDMSFLERTSNTISVSILRIFGRQMWYFFSSVGEQFDLDDEINTMSLSMISKLTDLMLGNFDFAIEYPFAITPNIIPVGGLTAEDSNDLSEELEDFVQSSGDDGIVLFTLGTYFASFTTSRPQFVKMFIDAFAKIPQKVIMQLKVIPDYDLPPNIKALPWLPQNDLLGHPKTRLLVYQGGNNGFYEAVYHGVPVIVLPFLGDQIDNAARATSHGIGLHLHKEKLSVDYIHQSVAEVLGDQKYGTAAKRLSAILRDRPMKPADRAAFWIQHVIKHGGGYMQSPATDMSFIPYNLIDVYAFLASIVAMFMFVLNKTLRYCISCCCGRKKTLTSKSKID